VGCHVRAARGAVRAAAAAAFVSTLMLAGCTGTGPLASAGPSARMRGSVAFAYVENARLGATARSYWTGTRLAHARSWLRPAGHEPAARPARTVRAMMHVGALFSHDPGGDHFCTASVVSSPRRDMLITAAHCVHGGKGKTYRQDIVFVPGYRNGAMPYGIWVPRTMVVARAWTRSSDPALDVAFVVLQPRHGRNIQQVLGANKLGVNQGFHHVVRVTGYPGNGKQPITCINSTSWQSRKQMRFVCKGYSVGTSGSPWVERFNPVTHRGTVIGVIGGYQRGGDTPDVSYSSYFDGNIKRLYEEAAGQS
jgi:V8-like Glu-specific endopeptidase